MKRRIKKYMKDKTDIQQQNTVNKVLIQYSMLIFPTIIKCQAVVMKIKQWHNFLLSTTDNRRDEETTEVLLTHNTPHACL